MGIIAALSFPFFCDFWMLGIIEALGFPFFIYIYYLLVVWKVCIVTAQLIGVEDAKTPAGAAGQVRPHRRLSAEEAQRPPRGKRSAWNGNQQTN
ncbi:hypothetical protein B1NLA3E_02320 [Bacillus sp. 1NLA3E]|nr:hypothetical protein B1NLA3E_02320 [Bacillus sp. 1NLA3E]